MDSAHQVIVAARATNQTSDKQQAAAMMEETIDNVGAVPPWNRWMVASMTC